MKILMFGRGVIATIYGRALSAAGHDVQFYVRPGRAAQYGESVRMDVIDARRAAPGGGLRGTFPILLRESVDAGDGFDLIVLSVPHHRLPDAAAFLAPRIGKATVLVFGNVWEEPARALAPIPADQVVFGFPQAGGGFGADGVLHGALLRSVIIGVAEETPRPREREALDALRSAGLTAKLQRDMRGWLYLHFIADAGMFAQSPALAEMIGDRGAFRGALTTTRELLPVVAGRGVDLRRHRSTTLTSRIPGIAGTIMAGATARFPIAQASLKAHTDPAAAEPRAILRDTLQTARRLGIPTPRLQAAIDRTAR